MRKEFETEKRNIEMCRKAFVVTFNCAISARCGTKKLQRIVGGLEGS